jgi:hypothetical protein
VSIKIFSDEDDLLLLLLLLLPFLLLLPYFSPLFLPTDSLFNVTIRIVMPLKGSSTINHPQSTIIA